MTSLSPGTDQATLEQPSTAAEDFVTAAAENLIVGRTLGFPIYDNDHLLLLAEGLTITSEFKRLLRDRRIREIRLHATDAENLTLPVGQGDETDDLGLDDAVVQKLNEIIDSGLLFVVNSDSAVRQNMPAPGCKGYDLARHSERIDQNHTTSLFLDGLMHNALRGKTVAGQDLTQLSAHYLNEMTQDVDSVLASVFESIQDKPITDHCVKMAMLGMAMGIEMGLDAHNVRNIGTAAMIHDWGMARVSANIRNADRRLSETEYFEIKKHPIYTLRLLEKLTGIPSVVPLVCYQVHERPNGNGYPQGRTGDRIHVMAKILNVADMYNALASPRPFRPPLTRYAAMESILRQAHAREVDAQVAFALLKVQSLFPVGSYVVLNDGSVGQVLRRNGDNYAQPIVRVVQNSQGKELAADDPSAIVDLSRTDFDVVQSLPTPGRQEIGLSDEILQCRRPDSGPTTDTAATGNASSPLSTMFRAAATAARPGASRARISLEDYSEQQKRHARWAIEMLDRSAAVADRNFSELREYERKKLHGVVNICIPNSDSPIVEHRGSKAFRAVCRDLSASGLCFIHPAPLAEDHLIVGLNVSENDGKWFHAEIVRRREIAPTEFWEYGVAFRRALVV